MGFLKGGVAFRRFRVGGSKPRAFGGEHLARLAEFALGRTRPPAEVLDGWAAGGHIRDAEFCEIKNVYPDHLLWDFWTEANKLPADRLKAYYTIDLKALSRDNPSGLASARQKREAKESARDRLEQEARDGRYKKWQLKSCLWDLTDGTVYFGGSAAAADRFARLFEASFGASLLTGDRLAGDLAPVTAGTLAVALHPTAKHSDLSEFVADGRGPLDRPSWCPLDTQPDWLGNEFLLWLWFHSEVHGDTVTLPDGGACTFMFAGGIKVEDPRGQSGKGVMNSGSAVRLPEAKAAVKSGKLPRKAALTLVRDGEQFTCVVEAETLAVSQGKLPPPEADATGRARDESRLQGVRDLAGLVDAVYAAFLARRMSSYWADELKGMQGWLRGGRRANAA